MPYSSPAAPPSELQKMTSSTRKTATAGDAGAGGGRRKNTSQPKQQQDYHRKLPYTDTSFRVMSEHPTNEEYHEILKSNAVVHRMLPKDQKFKHAFLVYCFLRDVMGGKFIRYSTSKGGYVALQDAHGAAMISTAIGNDELSKDVLASNPMWLLGNHDPFGYHEGLPFVRRSQSRKTWTRLRSLQDARAVLNAEGVANLLILPAGVGLSSNHAGNLTFMSLPSSIKSSSVGGNNAPATAALNKAIRCSSSSAGSSSSSRSSAPTSSSLPAATDVSTGRVTPSPSSHREQVDVNKNNNPIPHLPSADKTPKARGSKRGRPEEENDRPEGPSSAGGIVSPSPTHPEASGAVDPVTVTSQQEPERKRSRSDVQAALPPLPPLAPEYDLDLPLPEVDDEVALKDIGSFRGDDWDFLRECLDQ